MKGHKLFNKAVAGVLTLALALGIAPAAIEGGIESYADTATLSVSAYATKAQLTDDTFKPNDDGTATNIGKIKFGGKAWYLLGGNGTNADVFAAENFGNLYFQPTDSMAITPDVDLWNSVTYTNGDKPSTVFCNNYGASNLRKTLQDLASGEAFNSVEKSMLPSEGIAVTTSDLKNKAADNYTNLTYTTKDKLYAASAGDNVFTTNGTTIDVNGKKLDIKNTYKNGTAFLLRSPCSEGYYKVLGAITGSYVDQYNAYYSECGVRPASNLDFSSVLFASAAPVASSDVDKTNIASGTTMNLRLEATDSTAVTKAQLGSATVIIKGDAITATKGTAASVTLVVQGNDETNDWYYTKEINASGETEITADQIGIDSGALENCKVWLEATGSDGMIYATNAAVNNSEIYNVTFMNNNGTPDSLKQVLEGSKLTAPSITKAGYKLEGWYQNGNFAGEAWDFDEDTVTGEMTLYAKWVKADKDSDKGGSDSDNAGSGSDNNGSSSNGAAGSDSDTSDSDSSSETGDDTNVFAMMMLATLAALGGTGVLYVRRRHN